jgi:hypothetical protein
MDITKLPAPESGAPGVATPGVATPAEQGTEAPPALAAMADRVDIRPLDISGALQILIAEVRASFVSQALLAADTGTAPALDNVLQTARAVMEIILQVMPEEAGNAQWGTALARMEMTLQAGFERATNAVTLWRDVGAPVVQAVNQTSALILALLDEGPQNPIWLRPEWVALAPRFDRFWRRRRHARRRLTDPDYYSAESFDRDEPQS